MGLEIKTSIVMPYFNHWDLTHARLAEFRQYLPKDCEIVLVDDASTDTDVRSGTAFWQKSGIAIHPIKYIRNSENLGFTKSINRGYKVSTGKIIVFYSNDVIMTGNIVGETVEILEKTEQKILVGGRSVYWDGGWNSFEINGKKIIVPYLEGFYIAGKRESFDELGGWDERYAPSDMEDVDISFHAFLLGYNLVSLSNKHLKHLSGQTAIMNEQRAEITKRNKERFFEKWQSELSKL